MNTIDTAYIDCPYCGEQIELLIDCSINVQEYIEDCEICCKPINLRVDIDGNGNISVIPRHDNEC
jgi:hypothetical protein